MSGSLALRSGDSCSTDKPLVSGTSADAPSSMCSLQAEYQQIAFPERKKESAPSQEKTEPHLVPGESTVVPLTVDGQNRSYQIYWPKSRSVDQKIPVVFAADGLSKANSDPANRMGGQYGLFAEAEQDGFAVATLQPQRQDWFGLGLIHLVDWNVLHTVMGFDPKQQDDSKYANAVQQDISKRFNVDPSHKNQFCTGFSNGGQLCSVMDVAATAFNASTALTDEPLPKPGMSALIIHGQNDQVLPYRGGKYGATSFAGFNISWVNHNLPDGQFNLSAPYKLEQNYVAANNLSRRATADNPYFTKQAYGTDQSTARVTEYQIKAPYGGHNYNGGHARSSFDYLFSANNNVVPRKYFDATHVAACFFGLRKNPDCAREGVED